MTHLWSDTIARSPGRRRPEGQSANRASLAFASVRLGWGLLLFGLSPDVIRRLPLALDQRAVRTTRVLGLRHLAQAAFMFRGRSFLRAGIEIDLAHGASMLALAFFDEKRRQVARVDAMVAFGFAVGGLVVMKTSQQTRPVESTTAIVGADPSFEK